MTQHIAPATTSRRLPGVIYVLTAGTFLMGTSEFVVAGLLEELAADFSTSVAHAGLSISVFAVGMIVGAPLMALVTIRVPRRVTLTAALAVFALGHVISGLTASFEVLLAARFLTALATGAFWAVGSVSAAQAVGPAGASRALGFVLGGGMLANVLGVPLGAFSGQLVGWRGTFWALAIFAAIAAVATARMMPADAPGRALPSVRSEVRALRNLRLWLTLAVCALVNAGVLSLYSYISPLMTESAGLPASVVPLALMMFGVGALIGNIVGGRLGETHPFATTLVTAGTTIAIAGAIWAFSAQPVALMILFALLGLVGLSANPILVSLAIRYGGDAPTLAGAMPTSIFNLGTAVGTAVTAAALGSDVGTAAPALVGTVAGALVLVPLIGLALTDRRHHRLKPQVPASTRTMVD